jgi:DnaJ family protein C protein 19
MATPLIVGIGAITAALVGRQLLRRGAAQASEQWVKGGFRAKMDRKEAIDILGLKYVLLGFRRDYVLSRTLSPR